MSTPRSRASDSSFASPSKTAGDTRCSVRFRAQRHPRSFGIHGGGAIFSRQPAAGQRTERREADASIAAQGKQLALRRSLEQAVRVLHPFEAHVPAQFADVERAREPPRFDVAGAHVQNLARAAEIVQRAQRFLERRFRIRLVDQVHVQSVRLEPRQACVDLLNDVPARQPAIIGTGADRVEDFRAEEHLLANRGPLRPQPAADIRFAAPAAVRVGGIEKVHAGVSRVIEQGECLLFVLTHAEERRCRADPAEVAAAQTESR